MGARGDDDPKIDCHHCHEPADVGQEYCNRCGQAVEGYGAEMITDYFNA